MSTMDVRLPDGTVVRGVPANITRAELAQRLQKNGMAVPADWLAAERPKTPETKYDPAEGMSTVERAAAGAGKAMVDLARGVGQMIPIRRDGQWSTMVTREDVAEARKRDEPLMNTSAGKVGNIGGAVATMLPTAFIPGANTLAGAGAIGAVSGLLQPSTSTTETVTQTGAGGLLGPAALLAGRAIGSVAQGGRALLDPLTTKGQDRVAAQTLQSFATDPRAAASNLARAREIVPGSAPTMAQAARDPGLAQLERSLVAKPETGGLLSARFADQRAARLGAIQNVAGADDYYNAVKAGRATFAKQDYDAAIAAGFDMKALEKARPQLEKIMSRPSVEQAKRVAVSLARESDQTIDDFGSVRGLDYLVKALDNQISAAKSGGSSIGKEELRALTQTKSDLLGVIEKVAPSYKEARDNFAAMSRQVNAMDVARELQRAYEPALGRFGANTREMGQAYGRALNNATESVKRATGMDRPLADIMPTADIAALESVARDLASKTAAEEMGRSVGSNTAQNLASQNLMRRILGPMGMPETAGESTIAQTIASPLTGLYRLGGAEPKILERLSQAALDPADAARLLLMAQQPSRVGLLGMRSQPYLPVLPLGLLTSE